MNRFGKVKSWLALAFVIGGIVTVIAGPNGPIGWFSSHHGDSYSTPTSTAAPASSGGSTSPYATIPFPVGLYGTQYTGAVLLQGTRVQLICGSGSASVGYNFTVTVLSGPYDGTTGTIQVGAQPGGTLSAPWSTTQACGG